VTKEDEKERVSSQSIFATLLKCSDGSYAIKPIKVKIEVRHFDSCTFFPHLVIATLILLSMAEQYMLLTIYLVLIRILMAKRGRSVW